MFSRCSRLAIGGHHHVPGVPEAVHAANLVAVVRGNRHLGDAAAGQHQLDDDLGVEVEDVRVVPERNPRKRRDAVGAEAGVELRQLRAEQPVLQEREDLVPDELVERHAALAAPTPGTSMREPITASAAPSRMRRQQRGYGLGRILPVAVEQHDDVEAVADRVLVPELLVPAVALVLGVVEHCDRDDGWPRAERSPTSNVRSRDESSMTRTSVS